MIAGLVCCCVGLAAIAVAGWARACWWKCEAARMSKSRNYWIGVAGAASESRDFWLCETSRLQAEADDKGRWVHGTIGDGPP